MSATGIPPRPADEDWRAETTAQIEQMKAYIQARYGDEAAQDWVDSHTARPT